MEKLSLKVLAERIDAVVARLDAVDARLDAAARHVATLTQQSRNNVMANANQPALHRKATPVVTRSSVRTPAMEAARQLAMTSGKVQKVVN